MERKLDALNPSEKRVDNSSIRMGNRPQERHDLNRSGLELQELQNQNDKPKRMTLSRRAPGQMKTSLHPYKEENKEPLG